MKQRGGFVSNSSSSSFLLCYNDKSDFDCIKEYEGYDTFMSDLCPSDEQAIIEFLHNQYEHIVYMYRWYVEAQKKHWSSWHNSNPMKELAEMCSRLNCATDEIVQTINEGARLIEQDCEHLNFDGVAKLASKFARLVYDAVKGKWANMGIVGYSDNDGDFYAYMEHDFMYDIVGNHEADANYCIIIRNEH